MADGDFTHALDRTPLAQRREFIEKAKNLKNEGNEHYRKLLEEYKKPVDHQDKSVLEKAQKGAKRLYHLARLQTQAAWPFSASNFKKEAKANAASTSARDEDAELHSEWSDLVASIYNNLAAVILAYPEGQKDEDYARAAEFCSNVLLIDKDNSKAMYRKAQALEKMGHLRRALTYYRDADLAEKHQNAVIQRDLNRLKTQLEVAKRQSKEEFKDNFRRGISKSGLGMSKDAIVYGKSEQKPKPGKKRYADSPSRGSSPSPSSSAESDSSSSGRSSDEE